MFLHQLEKQNPKLIDFAVELYQSGEILADTYVLDLDMIVSNTKKMVSTAKANDIELLYMTKQIGRNPLVAKEITKAGISKAVVVDYREAEIFMQNNLPLGNVGHLVQPPKHFLHKLLTYGTKYVTVYSLANAINLNNTAKTVGVIQPIILKIIDYQDNIYPGQIGGFSIENLKNQISQLNNLNYLKIVGVTTFPAILFNDKVGTFEATKNVQTLAKAKSIFNQSNLSLDVISLPSATCTDTIPFIKQLGGTEGEPGHALTGTTPMHASHEAPEKPAYCYISEISHTFGSHSFVFGGGWYRRGHLKNALVVKGDKRMHAQVLPLENSNIDYHLELDQKFQTGLPVIMDFRTQIFVTRSTVAVVKGLHNNGHPELVGLFDSVGKLLPEGMK